HPTLIDSRHVELSDGQSGVRTLESIYGYSVGLRQRGPEWAASIQQLMDEASVRHKD
ncbi:MAG TPA: FMN-binding glutamate synthase family protein, partial [Verrucomicrobiales bacterium]|nr:FMN-binding glutamate synthase family protein [Verrucomicrobiales bacterium]